MRCTDTSTGAGLGWAVVRVRSSSPAWHAVRARAPHALLALLLGWAAAPTAGAAPRFNLGFEPQGFACGDRLIGEPGARRQLVFYVVLTTLNNDTGAGANSWTLSIGGENLRFLKASNCGILDDGSISLPASGWYQADGGLRAPAAGAGGGTCEVLAEHHPLYNPILPSDLLVPAAQAPRDDHGGYALAVRAGQGKIVDPGKVPLDGPLAGRPQGEGVIETVQLNPVNLEVSLPPNGTARLLEIQAEAAFPDRGQTPAVARIFFVDGKKGTGPASKNRIVHLGASRLPFQEDCRVVLETMARFRRGDVDLTGEMDFNDPIQLVHFLYFNDLSAIACEDAADFDDNGKIDLSDIIAGFEFLFLSGAPPAPPGPANCGPDPTVDELRACGYTGKC